MDKTFRWLSFALMALALGSAVSCTPRANGPAGIDVAAEIDRFTGDGIYMWPDAPSIEGREALREWFEKRFAAVDVNLESTTEEIEVFGDWAFERGTYVAHIRPKGAEEAETIRGKHLNILRRQPDGTWRIARRMRNRDHPAERKERSR